ncbi:MAG: hypothetical protein ACKVKG_16815 [Alphaproteobacteria bacterium]|jgi:hypothetical protein
MTLKLSAIPALLSLALLAACAPSGDKQDGPDWSKSSVHKVTTRNGDHVTARVVGDAKNGYDYDARIRRMSRANTDTQDRQRVLSDATQSLMSSLCGAGYKQERPFNSANYFSQRGRFVCSGK